MGASLAPAGVAVAVAGPRPPVATAPIAGDDIAPVLQRVDGATAPTPAPAPQPATGTWTVAAGDHLWSIAERVLSSAWGRPPTEREVVPFWRQVVARNRDRLAVPDNADLIFPGQVLLLPEPPPAG